MGRKYRILWRGEPVLLLCDWFSLTKIVWEKENGQSFFSTWVYWMSCRLVSGYDRCSIVSSDRLEWEMRAATLCHSE